MRIGEWIGRLVPLSHHDVEEILHEQRGTRRRFGEIAIALGLCRPEHVWRAWSNQLAQTHERVDLESIGVDAQAVSMLPESIASRHRVIPIRVMEGELVIAAAEAPSDAAIEEIQRMAGTKVSYVTADRAQIERAIREYYEFAMV